MFEKEIEIAAARELWQYAERSTSNFLDRIDNSVKFHVGTGSALAGWFVTHGRVDILSAFFILSLGILGAGHVVYYHNRANLMHAKARQLAQIYTEMADLPESVRLYPPESEFKKLLRRGHPITAMFFDALMILGISIAYFTIFVLIGGSTY